MEILDAPYCISCTRQADSILDGSIPFIKSLNGNFSMTPQLLPSLNEYMGVRFNHGPSNYSPHVINTHLETSHHVMANGTSVSQVKPLFDKKPLLGVHILVSPLHVKTTVDSSAVKKFTTSEGCAVEEIKLHFTTVTDGEELTDTYTMFHRQDVQFDKDRIVIETDIEQTLASFTGAQLEEAQVVMIHFDGGEKEHENWPFLTDQAIQALMKYKFKAIVLNLPSIDRL